MAGKVGVNSILTKREVEGKNRMFVIHNKHIQFCIRLRTNAVKVL